MPRWTPEELRAFERRCAAQKVRAARPEEKAKRSADTKAWLERNGHPRGFSGHKRTEAEKKNISEAVKRMWADPTHKVNSKQHRDSLSKHFSEVASTKTAAQCFSRTRKGLREDIGISVRSSWEANYARYLNLLIKANQILRWTYEPVTFWFDSIKRGCRSWKPDFRVETATGVEYHEVKGWMYPRAKTALKRMRIYHPTVTVVLIDEARYRAIEKTCAAIIPNWEYRQLNKLKSRLGANALK